MSKPVIGITVSEIPNRHAVWASVIQGQSYTYVDAVVRAGGIPVLIPIIYETSVLHDVYAMCDGLLFAGGADIDPDMYGEKTHPKLGTLSPNCDHQDAQLLRWAIDDNKSVFCICRGLQMLNVVQGGTLYQDIKSQVVSDIDHETSATHCDTTYVAHQLQIESASKLGKIIGQDPLPANSQHHQAIKQLGSDLAVTATTSDGVIEAVELPAANFVIGVQSHPEGMEASVEPRWRSVFKAFVEAAKSQ